MFNKITCVHSHVVNDSIYLQKLCVVIDTFRHKRKLLSIGHCSFLKVPKIITYF